MNKKIILIIILFAAAGGILFISMRKPKQDQNLTLLPTKEIPLPGTPLSSPSGSDEFSLLLTSISRIAIDTSLFQSPAYLALRDYPVVLGTDIVGRVNPFAPIGVDAGGREGIPLTIQTVQPGKITSTSAELGAQITLLDTAPTSVVFEYGESDTFGQATAPVIIKKSQTVLVPIQGLTPETTYYVRAVAVHLGETTTAQTMSFTTTKAPTRR